MRRLAVPLLLSAFCLLLSIFGFFFHRDNFSTHYPIKFISAAAFRAGEVPYWNFFDGGGQPLAGNPNTLTFYPDNFLYLILPPHVAFNLHFLIHLILGWLAMRALTRSSFAAWMLVLSGVAVSALSFYSLVTAIALVPFAFLATERRSPLQIGLAFGLMALSGEPVTIIATAIACAIIGPEWALVEAIPVAFGIALPQLVAWAEIARATERGAHRFSAATALTASLEPKRILELFVGPFRTVEAAHLFPTLLLGVIIIPALFRRSRYTIVAAVMLFFALGSYNPIVRRAVESFDWLRIARYPEKFALPMCVALIVLAAQVQRRAPVVWGLVTFIPLAAWAVVLAPVDAFSYYRTVPRPAVRVYAPPPRGGQEVDREDYRRRAQRLDPLFGATANIRYAVDRSPDGMFSILTRIAAERFAATRNLRWLRIAGCANVRDAFPRAAFVPRAIGARSIQEVVRTIEDPMFDERAAAVAPVRLDGFLSAAGARVTGVAERVQSLEIAVTTPAPALLLVNETYFRGWVARIGDRELETFPVDLDRLGVMVPAGSATIVLRFGRHRTLVLAAWVISNVLLLLCAFFLLAFEKRDRGAGEVERAADEDRPLG